MENKRIWAMVGVVYVIMATLLTTYWMATSTQLTGITGLVLFPLVAGLAVQCFNSRWQVLHQQQGASGDPRLLLLLGLACIVASIACLVWGAGQLMTQLN
ncbi:MAG: hypothetical protein IJD21_01080 [Oscillospiraceae bacterium]|nr:hypothetical protein [Oscillospiraceae bacterium]